MIRRRLIPAAAALSLLALVTGPARASSDEYTGLLWGIRKVGAETAWAKGMGAGVTIAVVDTGVDSGHEDLHDNAVPGRDFVDGDTNPSDEHGHGTRVAGTAAAVANNGIGVAGVAPRAKIMPIRVLNKDGEATLQDVEDSVRYAVDNGAKVVNLSLGGDVVIENLTGGSLTGVVNYAWSKGAIAIIAAGNDALFPSGYRDVDGLVVAATGPNDEKPSYSNGVGLAKWGLAAPGGSSSGGEQNLIFSTYWSKTGSRYGYAAGTSMAAPHVAGAAAVLLGLGLSPQQVVDRLLESAVELGAPGNDPIFGHGRLDVAAAVEGLKGSGGSSASGGPASGGGGAPPPGPAGGGGSSGGSSRGAAAGGEDAATPTPEADGPSDDQKLASEARDEERSPLPNIITGAVIGAAGIGAWGYYGIRRLRARRSSG